MSTHQRYEPLAADELEGQSNSPSLDGSSNFSIVVPDSAPAFLPPRATNSVAEVLEPPSYIVAVSLPTYDESLTAKQQEEEEQQHLCDATTSEELSRDAHRQVNNIIGTDAMFVLGFIFAFLFNWVGLIAAFCLMRSVAGRFGALTGFGLSLVKWVAIAKHHHWSLGVSDESLWIWWMLFVFGILISCSSTLQYLRVKYLWSRGRGTTAALW